MRQFVEKPRFAVALALLGAMISFMATANTGHAQHCPTFGGCGGPCGDLGAGVCMTDPASGACDCVAPPPRFDHLKCYEAKDELKVDNEFIARALQEEFGVEKCRIHGRRRLFCIPVSKEQVSPPAPEEGLFDDLPMTLMPDRICYQVSCDWERRKQEVTDQFGNRTLQLGQPQWFCTPAIKGFPPPPECGLIGSQCGGTCPNPGDVCQSTSAVTQCECRPPLIPCEQSAPVCGGACDAGFSCGVLPDEQSCRCLPVITDG